MMEFFIETRFGDPILAMDISKDFIVYGSALGQIGLFYFSSKDQLLLTEIAEEGIKGIHINNAGHIYASIGDLYILVFKRENNQWIHESIPFENRQHTQYICGNTQVLQNKMKVCLLAIDNSILSLSEKFEIKHKLFVFDCSNGCSEEYKEINFPKYSVPFCFTGDELVWMERDSEGNKVLKLLIFETLRIQTVKYFGKEFGNVSCLWMFKEFLMFVHDFNQIKIMELGTGEIVKCIGQTDCEILAIFPCFTSFCDETDSSKLAKTENLVVSVDKSAKICIWYDCEPVETIDLCHLDGIKVDSHDRYFGMGYPYQLVVNNNIIVISTDIGIIVVKSEYLASI